MRQELKPVGYIAALDGGEYQVGARDEARNYTGPVARVYVRDSWLYIENDAYEGAMLNAETIPFLREALERLEKAQK